MRQAVWRKLMVALHPDKGGDVRVFQHVSSLKRQVDAGDEVTLSHAASSSARDGAAGEAAGSVAGFDRRAALEECSENEQADASLGVGIGESASMDEELYVRVRAVLQEAARGLVATRRGR